LFLLPSEKKEFTLNVNVIPMTVELMYEPRQAANTNEDKFRVVR